MVGKSLSHYKILSELGRGGMGIVFKAEDTKLDRIVAIKVLPSAALASEDDRERFYREAKAAAQLHHPHIASVFEIDEAVPSDAPHGTEPSPFIAMEFIEGETLQDRIATGPLKLDEAVRIASEIGSALEAAHEKNIVHRDIKSANVMLTTKGSAKVLDFGLAKTAQSTMLTRMGSTLGTVTFMSPEQTRGEDVDSRSDLWSLGVVLYEMVTGRHPFAGDYEQAVIYSILNEMPEPVTGLRAGVPMAMEWIVSKCLAKKADERYQTATDLLVDLKTIDLSGSGMSRMSGVVSAVSGPQSIHGQPSIQTATSTSSLLSAAKTTWPLIAVAFLAALAFGYVAFSGGGAGAPTAELQKLPLMLDGITFAYELSISPNSDYIAFAGEDTLGNEGIFLFDVKTSQIIYVEGSTEGNRPIFSPDGTRIVFTNQGVTYLFSVPSGVPNRILDARFVSAWDSDRSILFHSDNSTMRFDIISGETTPVVWPDTSSDDPYSYQVFSVIPGTRMGVGHRIVGRTSDFSLFLADLDTGERQILEAGIFRPQYTPGGSLVYNSGAFDGPVVVRSFDYESGEFTGPPENLLTNIVFWGHNVGADGSYLYLPDLMNQTETIGQLYLFDIGKKTTESIPTRLSGRGIVVRPAFSPSGDAIVVHVETEGGSPFYISEYSLAQKIFRPRTFGDQRRDPDWSADGSSIYFDGIESPSPGIYKQSIDIDGAETIVIEGDAANPNPSSDGKWLAFSRDGDVFLLDLESGVETVVDSSDGNNWHPDFSPDNRYLAYESNSSGSWDAVIRPVSGTAYSPIRQNGARRPKWAPDGKNLYFLIENDGIYRLPVTTEPIFQVLGEAEKIVSITFGPSGTWFDISPDGTTLAITAAAVDSDTRAEQKTYTTLMWWQNWAQSLKKE